MMACRPTGSDSGPGLVANHDRLGRRIDWELVRVIAFSAACFLIVVGFLIYSTGLGLARFIDWYRFGRVEAGSGPIEVPPGEYLLEFSVALPPAGPYSEITSEVVIEPGGSAVVEREDGPFPDSERVCRGGCQYVETFRITNCLPSDVPLTYQWRGKASGSSEYLNDVEVLVGDLIEVDSASTCD